MNSKYLWIFLLVGLLWACKTDSGNANGPKTIVRIGSFSQAVDYAPYLIAKKKGWFEAALKDQNTTLIYTAFESLPPINEAFATNQIDIVFEAEPPAIIGEAGGVKLDVMDISCSLIQTLVVPSDSDIDSIADLKGKKIAVLTGTSSHYGLIKLLDEAGINASEVTILDMGPNDARAAFESGQIDAWAVWPPFTEQQEVSGRGRILPGGDAYIHSIMAVREGFMQDHPAIYAKIDSVFDHAKQWILDNEQEAIQLIAGELNTDIAVVEKAWPRHDWKATLNDDIVKDVQAKADFLVNEGKIKNKLDVQKDLIPLP